MQQNTKILLANNSYKYIKDIKKGDIIASFNFETKAIEPDIVIDFFVHEDKEYELIEINNRLNVTPNHPIYTKDGWKTAGELTLDDVLLDSDGGEEKIESLDRVVEETEVYNLETKLNHNYFAEGVLVHNKFLTTVQGLNPNTGERPISNLYTELTLDIVDEIFQTNLEDKFGPGIYGGKAVVYRNSNNKYVVAFQTETESTHHRHALARLVELNDPERNEEAQAFYDGNLQKSASLLSVSVGFELQFDKNIGKIVGIQQDSWITKRQVDNNIKFSEHDLEEFIIPFIESIDESLLDEKYKNLNWVDDPLIMRPDLLVAG